MSGVVRAGGEPHKIATFSAIEPFMAALATLREDVATARETTPDLLQKVERAMEEARIYEPELRAAAAPGGKVDVGTYLAMLLKAYPNSGQQDARFYGGFLHDDVMDQAPPIAAVEIACRHWRQKSKFLPAIAELLVEVRAAKNQVENAVEFAGRLPALRERMARELGET